MICLLLPSSSRFLPPSFWSHSPLLKPWSFFSHINFSTTGLHLRYKCPTSQISPCSKMTLCSLPPWNRQTHMRPSIRWSSFCQEKLSEFTGLTAWLIAKALIDLPWLSLPRSTTPSSPCLPSWAVFKSSKFLFVCSFCSKISPVALLAKYWRLCWMAKVELWAFLS